MYVYILSELEIFFDVFPQSVNCFFCLYAFYFRVCKVKLYELQSSTASTSTLEENAVEKSIEIYKLSDINFHLIDLSCIPNNSYK